MYVFTSPTCPHCPAAKEFASQVAKERGDVTLKNVVSGMSGSNGLFKKFDVASVPTIIIKGPGYDKNIGLRGAQPPKTLHKYLDLALGMQPQEEEAQARKGFFSRIGALFNALEE